MTYDEAQQKLTAIIGNPDTAAAELPAFLDLLKSDYETHAATVQRADAADERIRTLQDTNQRLFLMQTGQSIEPPQEPELTGQDAVNAFVNKMMSTNNKQEGE